MIRITVSRLRLLRIGLTMLCATLLSPLLWSNDYTAQRIEPVESGFLAFIPKMVNATPNVFPAQSDLAMVPAMHDTQENSWLDHQQRTIRDWADDTSQTMDGWFGEPDPNRPASATIRVLLDQSWSAGAGYAVNPRIRGNLRLPSLQKRLSLVFGDDRLDDEFNDNVANNSAQTTENPNASLNNAQVREDNSSIALRWSYWSKKLPFDTNIDLGIRSGDDVYVRSKLGKTWLLKDDFQMNLTQIYRYGYQSKNFWRSNFELTHQAPLQAQLSNQLNITFADEQIDNMIWENRSFRQHQFYKNQRFNYGIYTGGYDNSGNLHLNSWGPFTSWRQPLWREWFYVQADLSYLNDHRADQAHQLISFIRFESLF